MLCQLKSSGWKVPASSKARDWRGSGVGFSTPFAMPQSVPPNIHQTSKLELEADTSLAEATNGTMDALATRKCQ